MTVFTFNSNPITATRNNLSRRQHGNSFQIGGSQRQQQPPASRPEAGSRANKPSGEEWSLHDLDDPIEVSNNDSKPGRKRMKRKALWQGFMGVFTALSIIALWTRYSSHRSGHSNTTTFDEASDDYFTYDSDMTTLPPRSYALDEKYFILEYSPWLGFNNMRYMIERGLYLADILNRTLVIPTDLRIRSCSSSDETICAQTATYLTPGSANSRNEQGSVFALDMGYFFDLPHLAEKTEGRVIDFRTFMEEVIGAGTETLRRLRDTDFGVQVFFALRNKKYPGGHLEDGTDYSDNGVEEEEAEKESKDDKRKIKEIVLKTVQRKSWDLAEDPNLSLINNIIRNGLVDTLDEESDLQRQHGQVQEDGSVHVNRSFFAFADVQGGGVGRIVNWSVQFQYQPTSDKEDSTRRSRGRPLLDTCRSPQEDPLADQIPWESRFPGFATCHITNYVDLAQQLGPIDADVLVVEGQFHTTGWIPLAYSSLENAQKHRRMALSYLKYSPAVHEAADYLMGKLKARIQQRGGGGDGSPEEGDYSWLRLSMHVRRGDFVSEKHGWQKFDDGWMGSLVKEAVESVFGPLDPSLNISTPTPAPLYATDDTTDNPSHSDANNANNIPPPPQTPIKIPKFGFYMSTDETSPVVLDYFQSLGAILFEDLLDPTFESRFGNLIVFDDWIGLVEQLICARAGMFVGTMSSSFSSGILNLRLEDEGVDGEGEGRKFGYLYRKGGPILTPEQQQQQ